MKIRSRVATAAISLAAIVGGSLVAAAPAQAFPGVVSNCGAGVACLYAGPNDTFPITNAIAFGSENLFNVFGDKLYLNNQSQGWFAWACTGTGGTGTCWGIPRPTPTGFSFAVWDFTPFNSIAVGT